MRKGSSVDRLGFAELFLAEEGSETHAESQLHKQTDPENCVIEAVKVDDKVREDGSRASFVGRGGTRENCRDRSQHLSGDEGESDVETSHGLEKDHSKANTLQGIEDTQP